MQAQRLEYTNEVLEALQAMGSLSGLKLGQIVCIGVDDVRKKLGEEKWARTEGLVASLIEKAITQLSDPKDRYFKCRDASFLIFFADTDHDKAVAISAGIAAAVSKALFGQEFAKGLTVSGVVKTAEGLKLDKAEDPYAVLEALRGKAHVQLIGASPHPAPTAVPIGAVAEEELNNIRIAVDQDHSDLMKRLALIEDEPIVFKFLPVWRVSERLVHMFHCIPMRQSGTPDRPLWNYAVLGREPETDTIIELDIAAMERGLLKLSDSLLRGESNFLAPNIHFETLASRKGQAALLPLLQKLPEQVGRRLFPNIMHIPDGIPEGRLRDVTGQLRHLTNKLSALIIPHKLSMDLAQILRRLHEGGIPGVFVRLHRDPTKEDLRWVFTAAERTKAMGGFAGVTGVTDDHAFQQLADSHVDYCAGPIFGGPFDDIPAPYAFDKGILK